MNTQEKIKRDIIQSFGHAYKTFGLSNLMGRVVALLIFADKPLSLDDITIHLEMSKGPISQIARRLMDHNLIKKVWVPGSRRDYYEIHPDLFEIAFINNMQLNQDNLAIANNLKSQISATKDPSLKTLDNRLTEMLRFFELMMEHYHTFLNAWWREKVKLREAIEESNSEK